MHSNASRSGRSDLPVMKTYRAGSKRITRLAGGRHPSSTRTNQGFDSSVTHDTPRTIDERDSPTVDEQVRFLHGARILVGVAQSRGTTLSACPVRVQVPPPIPCWRSQKRGSPLKPDRLQVQILSPVRFMLQFPASEAARLERVICRCNSCLQYQFMSMYPNSRGSGLRIRPVLVQVQSSIPSSTPDLEDWTRPSDGR